MRQRQDKNKTFSLYILLKTTISSVVFRYKPKGRPKRVCLLVFVVNNSGLVLHLGLEELAVEAGDVADRNALGALGLAGTGVGAVTEAELIHTGEHSLGTAGCLNLTLRKEGELAHLGRYEEHGRAVLTSSYASTATDTCGSVHSLVGDGLGDGNCVGIGDTTGVHRHVTASLHDLVVGRAVDHQVADNGEASRAPGLYGDGVTILEAAHVHLAGGGTCSGTVGVTIDVE